MEQQETFQEQVARLRAKMAAEAEATRGLFAAARVEFAAQQVKMNDLLTRAEEFFTEQAERSLENVDTLAAIVREMQAMEAERTKKRRSERAAREARCAQRMPKGRGC